MKTLTKIKLINWHGFYNETIELSGSTLIVGENGTGKSTLLDAVFFVLTGGEEKFNTAANIKSSRTVETYMRGVTGNLGSGNLRNSPDLISHISLEYFDDRTKNNFVIGTVLEIVDNSHNVARSFYHIPNSKMYDEFFIQDGSYLSFRGMKKYFKENDKELNEISGNRGVIRKSFYRILDMDTTSDRYYELLPKAIAFNPIGDVNSFVYDFLMPEKNANIDEIKKTINAYNETRRQLEREREKKGALIEIAKYGDKYSSLVDEKFYLTFYRSKLQGEELNKRIESLEKAVNEKKEKIEEIKKTIATIQEEQNGYVVSKAAIDNSKEKEQLKIATKNLEEAKKEVATAKNNIETTNRLILSEDNIARRLEPYYKLAKYIKNPDYASFVQDVQSYADLVNSKRNELSKEITNVENEQELVKKKISDLSSLKDSLINGIPRYDSAVTELIALIKKDYYDAFKKDISVIPFCELIEIADGKTEFRNPLEGYLGNKRFDLFVYDKDYNFAVKTYLKYKNSHNLNSVGIVNTLKIPEKEVLPGSLAAMLKTDDSRAQKYINYLLGDVIYTGKENEVGKYDKSVSSEVFIYRDFVGRQKIKKGYSSPFIGVDALRIQLETVKKDLEEAEKVFNFNKTLLSDKYSFRKLLEQSQFSLLLNTGNIWGVLNEKEQRLSAAQRNYDAISANQELTKDIEMFDGLINKCKKDIEKAQADFQEVSTKKGKDEEKLEAANEQRKENDLVIEELSKDIIKSEKANTYINGHQLTLSEIRNSIDDIDRELKNITKILSNKMNAYIERFEFDATSDVDSLPAFYNELNVAVGREFTKYEEKVDRIQKEMNLIFKNSYITEIQNNIRAEKENINRLNEVLKERPFGSDGEIYKFIIEPSKDDKFGQYYEILTSNQNFDVDSPTLWTEGLSEKNDALMQELFNRLTKEGGEDQEKLVRDYTDYRKFMSYDIEITKKNGKKSRLSTINRGKSGGETQTPFYVVIAASFDQIVKGGFKSRSAGCLVMFDEAFYNMDESRIESMMQYFNNLSIQPLIAVPTSRCRSIIPHVKTVVPLTKSNDRITTFPWKK